MPCPTRGADFSAPLAGAGAGGAGIADGVRSRRGLNAAAP